jgi:transporter family-2 protein
MNWLVMGIAVVGGIAVAIQAGINGALGKKVGVVEGSLISFAIGTLALLIATVLFGKGNLASVVSVPKWQLLGGFLGAIYILIMIFAVPKIGVATAVVCLITGQILTSTIIDHFNLFGGRQIPVDWKRITGIVFLAIALVLFYKK